MSIEETIKFAKNSIERLFNNPLDIKTYGYLLEDIDLKDSYQYEITGDNYVWKQISDITVRNDDWWTYYVLLKLDFNGKIVVKDSLKIILETEKKFDLYIDLWFKTDRIQYTYRLLDKKYKIIKDYVEQIENTNISLGIYSLLNNNIRFNNINFLQFASDITRKSRNLNVCIKDNIIDDIARISQDLEYLLGEISQLKNYVGNYTSNPQLFDGKIYYMYDMSFIDKRYFFLIGVMFEVLYNFWDRIGDLLAIYFTPNLPEKQIYFPIVIDNIKSPYIQSPNYIWLKNFKDKEYNLLNIWRKKVVHYLNVESEYNKIYRSKFDNKAELLQLQDEKIGLTDILKNHFKLTISGFMKALLLIDEIN
ncbi:MAG: hypothetical protein AB1777_04180 [Bacteroidota bacterium]